MTNTNLKQARMAAIAQVDSARNTFWVCVVLAGLCEAGFLIALFFTLDWSDPTQRLITVATGFIYGTLGLCIFALGAYTRWWAMRIVRAVQLGPEYKGPEYGGPESKGTDSHGQAPTDS